MDEETTKNLFGIEKEKKTLIDRGERRSDFYERKLIERLNFNPEFLREQLKKRVIGQQEAINIFVDDLISQTVDFDPERPQSFLFLGPTGVGKNYLVEETARLIKLQGLLLEKRIIYGPAFNHGFEVTKLLGSPPGYVGGEINPVFKIAEEELDRSNYYFMIFDEFEKGHKKFHDLLLSLTDTGLIELADNSVVDLRKSTIVMTSNAGYSDIEMQKRNIGFGNSKKSSAESKGFIRKHFSPEFLGRTTLVHFNPLNEEDTRKVTLLELEKLVKKADKSGVELVVDSGIEEYIMRTAEWENYGCRNIRTVVNRKIGGLVNKKFLGIAADSYRSLSIDEWDEPLKYTVKNIRKLGLYLKVELENKRPEVKIYNKTGKTLYPSANKRFL